MTFFTDKVTANTEKGGSSSGKRKLEKLLLHWKKLIIITRLLKLNHIKGIYFRGINFRVTFAMWLFSQENFCSYILVAVYIHSTKSPLANLSCFQQLVTLIFPNRNIPWEYRNINVPWLISNIINDKIYKASHITDIISITFYH